MFIRVNKNTNEIDSGLIASDISLHPDIILQDGWEWIDTNDTWYVEYEQNKLNLEKELSEIEFQLKAETLELSEKELIEYLLKKVNSQNEIIDNLIVGTLNV